MDGHTWGSSQFMKAGMYVAAKARTTMKGAVSAVRTMVRKVLRSRRWSDEVSWRSDDVSMRERTVAAMLTFIALNTPQKRPIDRPSPAEITVIIQASLNSEIEEDGEEDELLLLLLLLFAAVVAEDDFFKEEEFEVDANER